MTVSVKIKTHRVPLAQNSNMEIVLCKLGPNFIHSNELNHTYIHKEV